MTAGGEDIMKQKKKLNRRGDLDKLITATCDADSLDGQ